MITVNWNDLEITVLLPIEGLNLIAASTIFYVQSLLGLRRTGMMTSLIIIIVEDQRGSFWLSEGLDFARKGNSVLLSRLEEQLILSFAEDLGCEAFLNPLCSWFLSRFAISLEHFT